MVDDVFLGSAAVAAGVVTSGQLRGPRFRRLFRDCYVRASVPITHELRCRGATLVLPGAAVITGRSAATIRRKRIAWPEDPVQVIAPPEARLGRKTGLLVRRTTIEPGDAERWAYGRLASPERMAIDLLLDRPLPDAVADLDAVLKAGLVDRAQLAALLEERSDNGIVLAREAVRLADPSADSLPESRLRVLMVLAGLAPVPQYWITDEHGRIAKTDFAFPEFRVAVEYDGDWRDGESWALNRDRERLNRILAAGWEVIFVTAPMLRNERKLLHLINATLAARTLAPRAHFGALTLS